MVLMSTLKMIIKTHRSIMLLLMVILLIEYNNLNPLLATNFHWNVESFRPIRWHLNLLFWNECYTFHWLIFIFIHLGWENITELLLKNGANVNAEDDKKQTPLHRAAENGSESSSFMSSFELCVNILNLKRL